MSKPVGIVIATRWEAHRLLKPFGFKRIGENLYKSETGKRPLLLAISGVGPEKARAAGYRLCDQGAGELISLGFCGALVASLKIGDLLTDRIVTSPKPVRTVEERVALAAKANALAVDMET